MLNWFTVQLAINCSMFDWISLCRLMANHVLQKVLFSAVDISRSTFGRGNCFKTETATSQYLPVLRSEQGDRAANTKSSCGSTAAAASQLLCLAERACSFVSFVTTMWRNTSINTCATCASCRAQRSLMHPVYWPFHSPFPPSQMHKKAFSLYCIYATFSIVLWELRSGHLLYA